MPNLSKTQLWEKCICFLKKKIDYNFCFETSFSKETQAMSANPSLPAPKVAAELWGAETKSRCVCVCVCVYVVRKLDKVVPLVSMSPSPHAGVWHVWSHPSWGSGVCSLLRSIRHLCPPWVYQTPSASPGPLWVRRIGESLSLSPAQLYCIDISLIPPRAEFPAALGLSQFSRLLLGIGTPVVSALKSFHLPGASILHWVAFRGAPASSSPSLPFWLSLPFFIHSRKL